MHGFTIPSTMKRPAKPAYGLPSAIAGKEYISHADKFGEKNWELYQEGKAWWEKDELVDLCNRLFPDWENEKWSNSASEYAKRIDAGASNPVRRDKVYRLLFDRESGVYVMCSVQEGINFADTGKAAERAMRNEAIKEQANLQKAHFHLDAETQKKVEAQFIKNRRDVAAAIYYSNNPQLSLFDSARAMLGNGNKESTHQPGDETQADAEE